MESLIFVWNVDVLVKEWYCNNRDNYYGIDEISVKYVFKLFSIGFYFVFGFFKILLFNVCDYC